MEKDEKITLWSERIHEFQSSGQTCKTWCQEHHVPVSTMNYWMHKLKTLDEQSDTDMIFGKYVIICTLITYLRTNKRYTGGEKQV